MDNIEIQKIKRQYQQQKLEMSYKTLCEIIDLINNFCKEGEARLIEFVHSRKRSKDEINHLSEYLLQARTKMEAEYERAKRRSVGYNERYPNNIGSYFGDISNFLSSLRSHMSSLKNFMSRGCQLPSYSQYEWLHHSIPKKQIIQNSILGKAPYSNPIFSLEEECEEVQYLYEQVKAFYAQEKKCMDLCVEILEKEKRIKNDIHLCNMLYNQDRQKEWEKMEDELCLITKDVIETIKDINPAYRDRGKYASEKDFAQYGFHRYTNTVLSNLYKLDYYVIKLETDYKDIELTMWGSEFDTIDNIRLVVANFDYLLPESFNRRQIGQYIFYFCQWSYPNNISKVYSYFCDNYNGRHKQKIVKYGSVHAHKKHFDEKHVDYLSFIRRITDLISLNGKMDWKKEFENRLTSC